MKHFYTIPFTAIALLITISCKKEKPEGQPTPEKPQPVLRYTDLSGKTLHEPNRAIHIDMDGDGSLDINIKTEPVSEQNNTEYRLKFAASAGVGNFILSDELERIPSLNAGDLISTNNTATCTWYDVTSVSMADKVTPANGNPYWEGHWQKSTHQFLPVMLLRGGKKYVGWVEIAINLQTGVLELYKAAISTEANKSVKAGA